MDFVDIFAGIARMIGDLVALASLIGSILVLGTGIVSVARGERIQFDEIPLRWSILGLVIGVISQFSLSQSSEFTITEPEGFLIGISFEIVNLILVVSLVLLMLGFFIRQRARRYV